MTRLPIERALDEAIDVLDGASVPYAVMGGFGVRAWGLPRPTYDCDLTVAVEPNRLGSLLKAFEDRGFVVPEAHSVGFADRVGPFTKVGLSRVEGGTAFDIDLFLAGTEFQKEAMSRRVPLDVGGRRQWVLSREDLILHKLIAGRRKDLVDVEEILLVATSVDRDYLRRWANVFGIEEPLEQALADAPHLK